jgi:tape measure domain-containing protein
VADPIDVPINLPTNASSVSAAAATVKLLEDTLAALGPAAKAGSNAAVSGVARISAQLTSARKEAGALEGQLALVAAKADAARAKAAAATATASAKGVAGVDVANAKGFQAFQLAQQKAVLDMGKLRAQQEGALEIANAKAVAKAKEQANAQTHAVAMAQIRQRADAEKQSVQRGKQGVAQTQEMSSEAAATESAMASAATGAAAAILAVVAAVIATTAKITTMFAVALVNAQAQVEAVRGAITKLLGSAGEADAVMKKTAKTAADIGLAYGAALTSMNALLAQGFKADAADTLIKAMADLKSVNPTANIESIVRAIGKIKATGHLQGDELNELNEAGLSSKLVYEALAKQMGKTVEEIQKMQKAGKLGADDVIKAILAGVGATTKMPLGEAAKEAANTLQSLIARTQELPQSLLMAADASKGMGVVKDVFKNLLAAAAPGTKSGDMLAASLGKMGNALATFLGGLTGEKGKASFETFVQGLAKTIDKIASYTEKVGNIIGPRLGKAFDFLGKSLDDGSLASGLDQLIGVFTGAIDIFLWTIAVVDDLREAFDTITDVAKLLGILPGAVNDTSPAVTSAGSALGANLVNGIIAGITGGLPGLLGVIASMAMTTTSAAQGGYQVKSPSVLWEKKIGYQLPAGQAKGIERGVPLVNRAIDRMAQSTTARAANANGGSASGVASGGNVYNVNLTFHGMTRSDADHYEARTRVLLQELAA